MTAALIIILVWILVGGGVYMLMLEDHREAYEIWCKHRLPPELFDRFFGSAEMLTLSIILGLPLVITAPIAYIIIYLKGGIDEK